jgi:hypothetical protein
MVECPECRFPAPAGEAECPRCGVVLERRGTRTGGRRPAAAATAPVSARWIERDEIVVLAVGLGAAVVAHVIPLTRFVFSVLVTLFHELGHAVVSWVLGYPAIPAFDFVYGGGFTHSGTFRVSLVLVVAGGLAALGWVVRKRRAPLVALAVVSALWLLVVNAEWRREVVIASAGHAGELVLAAIFFYMALTGVGWRVPEIERKLGAFVAFFVQIQVAAFAWRLGHDAAFLEQYLGGKGGALMNDLEVVALDLHIFAGVSPSVETLAGALFVASLLPLPAALLASRPRM